MDSSGGLVCAVNHILRDGTRREYKDYKIAIFNPLKCGRIENLVPMPTSFYEVEHVCDGPCGTTEVFIVRDTNSMSYKLLLAGFSILKDKIMLLQMYDCAKGCWRSIAPPALWRQPSSVATLADIESADLYLYCGPRTNEIYGYHMSSDTWSHVSLMGIPDTGLAEALCTRSIKIMKYKGSLIIAICFYLHEFAANMYGFSVYRLEHVANGATWKHISQTPVELLRKNALDTYGGIFILDPHTCFVSDVSFVNNRNLICMVSKCSKPMPAPQGKSFPKPLVYNLDTKSWFILPSYKNQRDGFALFSYKPSFI